MGQKAISLTLLILCLVCSFKIVSLDSFEKSINTHLSAENDFDFDRDGTTEEERGADERDKALALKDFIYIEQNSSLLTISLIFLKKISFPLINAIEINVPKNLDYPPESI